MAEVMARSGYTEEDVFDWGITGEIVFLVVVPEVGACRVPAEALSHFMAGAGEYAADAMPEHWSNSLSGPWTIKRDRLRILADSWEKFSDDCDKLADALDRTSALEVQPEVFQFTDHEAGHISTVTQTQAQRDKDIADKRERQAKGYYTMREVAQLLADTYGLDAAALLKKMTADYHAGKIVVRNRETEAPVLLDHKLRDFYDWMFPDDIRAMLKHWVWKRTFPFPASEHALELQAAPVVPAGASDGLKPTNKAKLVADFQSVDAVPLRGQSSEGNVPTAPVFSMTKAAMIAQHKRKWPTIERDMSDAKRNGLHIAKAGSRGWWEAKALDWARANNKLLDADRPAAGLALAINSMANLPGKKIEF